MADVCASHAIGHFRISIARLNSRLNTKTITTMKPFNIAFYVLVIFLGSLLPFIVVNPNAGTILNALLIIFSGALCLWIEIVLKRPRCPECGGTLFTWSYGKPKCNRDGDQTVTHEIY